MFVHTTDLLGQYTERFNALAPRPHIVQVGGGERVDSSQVIPDQKPVVVIATYQSLHTIPDAWKARCDFVVCDEAHHIVKDGQWAAKVRKFAAEKHTLKLSATFPARFKADVTVTTRQAIDDGIVADYRVLVCVFDKNGVRFSCVVDMYVVSIQLTPPSHAC